MEVEDIVFTPLRDGLLLEMDPPVLYTPSGIKIPDDAIHYPGTGRVLAVGPGRYNKQGIRKPVQVKVGDRVRIDISGETEINLNGKNYFIYPEHKLLGLVGES